MHKIKLISLYTTLFLCITHLIGCATIVSGTTQSITVTSNPEGATITVQPGEHKSITPDEIELERDGGPYRITVNLEGYESYSVVLTTSTNGWMWGNLLLGGLIGIIIDTSTGAAIKLSPDEVTANLHTAGITPQSLNKDQIYFFSNENILLGQLTLK